MPELTSVLLSPPSRLKPVPTEEKQPKHDAATTMLHCRDPVFFGGVLCAFFLTLSSDYDTFNQRGFRRLAVVLLLLFKNMLPFCHYVPEIDPIFFFLYFRPFFSIPDLLVVWPLTDILFLVMSLCHIFSTC